MQSLTALTVRNPTATTDHVLVPPTWMIAGNLPLSLLDLPIEILENVTLRLCAQEILKLRIVRLTFSPLLSRWFRISNVNSVFFCLLPLHIFS